MAEKLKAALPEFMDLGGGWVLEWDAVDPTTGASVSGVVVSNTSLMVAGDLGAGDQGPPVLVPAPLLAHEPGDA
jgi:hypothetical protein